MCTRFARGAPKYQEPNMHPGKPNKPRSTTVWLTCNDIAYLIHLTATVLNTCSKLLNSNSSRVKFVPGHKERSLFDPFVTLTQITSDRNCKALGRMQPLAMGTYCMSPAMPADAKLQNPMTQATGQLMRHATFMQQTQCETLHVQSNQADLATKDNLRVTIVGSVF